MKKRLRCVAPKGDVFYTVFLLSKRDFQLLGLTSYSYIKVRSEEGREIIARLKEGPKIIEGTIAIPLAYREELNVQEDSAVEIETLKYNTKISKVLRGYTKDLGNKIIRVPITDMDELGLKNGDSIEVVNRKNGGRFEGTVYCTEGNEKIGNIRMSSNIRSLLGVGLNSMVMVLNPTLLGKFLKTTESSKFDSIVGRLVGYRWIDLRVAKGEDTDEGAKTTRMRSDILALLGITAGDAVEIVWRGRSIICRVLPITLPSKYVNEQESGYTIQVCASERLLLEIDPGDSVHVRRLPRFVFKNHLDRVIAALLTAIGFYALITQEGLGGEVAIFLTFSIALTLIYLLFTKIRNEV